VECVNYIHTRYRVIYVDNRRQTQRHQRRCAETVQNVFVKRSLPEIYSVNKSINIHIILAMNCVQLSVCVCVLPYIIYIVNGYRVYVHEAYVRVGKRISLYIYIYIILYII